MSRAHHRAAGGTLSKRTLAVVMAGGNGTRLGELTRWDCKPALPFGGLYRNIDFPLSNCVNSDIRRIAVLTQYKAHSLIQHVTHGWNFLRPELDEFVELWPAQQRKGQRWYAGTADAVYQNIELIAERAPEYVLVLAGDHVYKMDYRPMIEAHAASGAAATVGCIEVPVEAAGAFGVMGVDGHGWVEAFQEKPEKPDAVPGRPDVALGSMGIYVFNRDFLLKALTADAGDASSSHDFGKDILPSLVRDRRLLAYAFRDDATGAPAYWRDVGTVDSYWQANLDLLDDDAPLDLHDPDWPLWTHQPLRTPSRFVRGGLATCSIVAPGSIVAGRVHRSVLFAGCAVAESSSIEGGLVLPGARIGRGCRMRNVIVDSGCSVPDGTVIDGEAEPGGITLVSAESATIATEATSTTARASRRRSAVRVAA